MKENKVPMTIHKSILSKHKSVRQKVLMSDSKTKTNVDYTIGVTKKVKKMLKKTKKRSKKIKKLKKIKKTKKV